MQIAYPRCIHTHARACIHQELEYLCIQISAAHRVGRLLAFLIEPFILALAYAHTARRRAYATRRDSSKRACVHTRKYIDYRCFAYPVPLVSRVSPSSCVVCRIGKLVAAIRSFRRLSEYHRAKRGNLQCEASN